MASTQKMILILIFMNLIIATAVNSQAGRNDQIFSRIGQINEEGQSRLTIIEEEDAWYQKAWSKASNLFSEVYDAIRIGFVVLWVFVKGIGSMLPGSLLFMSGLTQMEKYLIYFIELFRTTLLVLVALEAYMLYRNRKTGS